MPDIIDKLLQTENVAIVVLLAGNVAQWLRADARDKQHRADRAADAAAVAAALDRLMEPFRAMERMMAIVADRVQRDRG